MTGGAADHGDRGARGDRVGGDGDGEIGPLP
jgi:hypothetical protein